MIKCTIALLSPCQKLFAIQMDSKTTYSDPECRTEKVMIVAGEGRYDTKLGIYVYIRLNLKFMLFRHMSEQTINFSLTCHCGSKQIETNRLKRFGQGYHCY